MQSIDLFGSNFTSEDVIDDIQVSMEKILSEKLLVCTICRLSRVGVVCGCGM